MCPFVAVWPRRGTVPVPIVIEHATCIPAVGVVYGACWLSGRSNERPYVRVLVWCSLLWPSTSLYSNEHPLVGTLVRVSAQLTNKGIFASKMLVNPFGAASLLHCLPQSVLAALTQTGVMNNSTPSGLVHYCIAYPSLCSLRSHKLGL